MCYAHGAQLLSVLRYCIYSWFAYYYWLDDNAAPDFARCVAIHKKPGYDPAGSVLIASTVSYMNFVLQVTVLEHDLNTALLHMPVTVIMLSLSIAL
jgi:hypothetical protein